MIALMLVALQAFDLPGPTMPIPGYPREAHAILANGDRIAGRVVGGDARRVLFKSPNSDAELSIGVNQLAAVWWVDPPAELPADPARYPFLAGPKRDSILLADRDVRGGLVERLGGADLTWQREGKSDSILMDQVRAVVFDPLLIRDRKLRGPATRAILRDGSRLTFADSKIDAKTLTGKTTWGAVLTLRTADVCFMETIGTPGTDQMNAVPTIVPYNGDGDRPSTNRTQDGRLLNLPGFGVVDRGYHLPAGSQVVFKLDGKFRRWKATVGLSSGCRGIGLLQILLDGKEQSLGTVSPMLPGVSGELLLDVAGGKELTVRIAPGRGGNIENHAVLAYPTGIE